MNWRGDLAFDPLLARVAALSVAATRGLKDHRKTNDFVTPSSHASIDVSDPQKWVFQFGALVSHNHNTVPYMNGMYPHKPRQSRAPNIDI